MQHLEGLRWVNAAHHGVSVGAPTIVVAGMTDPQLTLTAFTLARANEEYEEYEAALAAYRAAIPGGPVEGRRTERALSRCEGYREIVETHSTERGGWCLDCQRQDAHGCPILRGLAAFWSDHPDYQDEWRHALWPRGRRPREEGARP